MTAQKYLLYIDFLGFSQLVDSRPEQVAKLYTLIDSLNVHRHDRFKVIAFSDTILVYNRADVATARGHQYTVMFACEFVQDLIYRLAGYGIFFRALLTYGDFRHYALEHIECFFGTALVDAYRREKQIPAIGMFMTTEASQYSNIYPTVPFGDDLRFVFVTQSIGHLNDATGGLLPCDVYHLRDAYSFPHILPELRFLHDLHAHSRLQQDPRIRAKHLTTYDLYRTRYPELMLNLEAGSFRPEAVCPDFDWSEMKAAFGFDHP